MAHQNSIGKVNKGIFKSVQNFLPFRLLSKNIKIKIYRIIILPVVLYGCEIWSFKLREKGGLMAFENMVLRRIFGPRRDEVTGEWRKLHSESFIDLRSAPRIIRAIKSIKIRQAGHVARMGERRDAYRVLVGKPGGKIGRYRRRWDDNIKMDLQEVGWWAWMD